MSYHIPMQEVIDMVLDAKKEGGLKIIGAYVRDATGSYYRVGIGKRLKGEFFQAWRIKRQYHIYYVNPIF